MCSGVLFLRPRFACVSPLASPVSFRSCGLLLLAATWSGVYWASQRVPRFYRDALEQEPTAQRQASEQMLENASALASNVSKEGRWSALFTADQINGWLAVDAVENHPELLSADISNPRVLIQAGPCDVRLPPRPGQPVDRRDALGPTATWSNRTSSPLRIERARAGVLPIPLSQILDGVAEAARRLKLHLAWRQVDGDPVALITIPPTRDSDDTEYQLEALELRDGEIYLAGRTQRAGASGEPAHERSPLVPLVADRSAENEKRQH